MAFLQYAGKSWLKEYIVWFTREDEQKIKSSDIIDFNCMRLPPEGYGRNIIKYNLQTIVIDLRCSEAELLAKMHAHTRKYIRDAAKDEIIVEYYDSEAIKKDDSLLDDFQYLYNKLVETKKLPNKANMELLKAYADAGILVLSCAQYEGKRIIIHLHITDGTVARALYSASLFRNMEDKEMINRILRANTMLHWNDMMRFKASGHTTYDFGGYEDKPELKGINFFKEGFGGTIIDIYQYRVPNSLLGSILIFRERVLRAIQSKKQKRAVTSLKEVSTLTRSS